MDFLMEQMFNEQESRWDVTLSGEIDVFNSPELKAKLAELLEERDADLYLHCARLDYIDSTALGVLVGIMKIIKNNNRAMRLLAVKPSLMKLFRITNLDKVFEIEGGIAHD